MEGMEWKGCVYRIRKCVFDLLSMEEDLIDDDEDTWELMGSSLRLKSTFLYCDLNQVISRAKDERKKFLTDLANKLFCYMEQVILLLAMLIPLIYLASRPSIFLLISVEPTEIQVLLVPNHLW